MLFFSPAWFFDPKSNLLGCDFYTAPSGEGIRVFTAATCCDNLRAPACAGALAGCKLRTMSTTPEIFAFEKDFAGALYCIPMVVRRKLDVCGVKVSLKQWNRFELEEREQLVAQNCETPHQVDEYTRYVAQLIETRTHEPAQFMAKDAGAEWNDMQSVPQRVIDYSHERAIAPPTLAQWTALTPLQRFAIFKLTRPGHSNENFLPAMREFGLIA